jgi:delta-aminolevulinic acid dehydratase/porphobilinogen synthase
MVKPAGAYLDIIKLLRENTSLPIAAYQVSGEYAMLKAVSERGWLDEVPSFLYPLFSNLLSPLLAPLLNSARISAPASAHTFSRLYSYVQRAVAMESLVAIRRAGADMIFTYTLSSSQLTQHRIA